MGDEMMLCAIVVALLLSLLLALLCRREFRLYASETLAAFLLAATPLVALVFAFVYLVFSP